MAKTNIRGTQIADGSSGVDLTLDVFGTLPVGNGGTGVANPTAGRFMVGNGTSVIDLSKVVPTGTVMGTSDAQVVTNKDLTSGTNTFPSSLSPATVRLAAGSNITLSGTQTIDGVAAVAGDRVLVRSQGVFAGNNFDNGVWVVAAGAWSRATDADTSAKIAGAQFLVTEGTQFKGQVFTCGFLSTDTLGTTPLSFYVARAEAGGVFTQPYGNRAGHMFYDTNSRFLDVYSGTAWNKIKGVQDYTSTAPVFPIAGELWYDSANNLLKVYTGTDWSTCGISDAMPIGTVFAFAGQSPPAGCLLADASSYLRTSYPDLFAALTTIKTGSGASGQKVITTSDTTGLAIGMRVEAAALSGGVDTIASVSPGVSFTVGVNLTGTMTNAAVTAFPHGAVDTTHFNTPAAAGKTIFGKDGTTEFATVGQTGGSKTQNLDHDHVKNAVGQTLSTATNVAGAYVISTGNFDGLSSAGANPLGTKTILPPYNTLTYCVKATSIWQNQGMDRDWIASQPASPTTGIMLFTRTRARRMPAFVGPTGQDNRLQPSMAFNTICAVNALNNSGTPDLQTIAVTHLNNAGSTVTAVPIATTNLFTSVPRYRCATTTVAGTGAGTRSTQAQWMLSSTINKGGLHFVCRFGFNLISSVSRSFVGMSTTTTALNAGADPSSFLNMFGFGFDLADTNLQFMSNDGTGVATKVNTGMAKGTGGTDLYEAELFAPSAGGSQVWYAVRRLNDETIFRGSSAVVTDLPAIDTLLSFHVHLSNGTAVVAHSIDIKSIYIESDV